MNHLLKKFNLQGAGLIGSLFGDKPKPEPATLKPPQLGDSQLGGSFTYAEILDLISDGPIEGLVNQNGLVLQNKDILQGIYLNDTSVAVSNDSVAQSKPIYDLSFNIYNRTSIETLKQFFTNLSKLNVSGDSSVLADLNYRDINSINTPDFKLENAESNYILKEGDLNTYYEEIKIGTYLDVYNSASLNSIYSLADENNYVNIFSLSQLTTNTISTLKNFDPDYLNDLKENYINKLTTLLSIYDDKNAISYEREYVDNIFKNNINEKWQDGPRADLLNGRFTLIGEDDMVFIVKFDDYKIPSDVSLLDNDTLSKFKFRIEGSLEEGLVDDDDNIKVYDFILPRINTNGKTTGSCLGFLMLVIKARKKLFYDELKESDVGSIETISGTNIVYINYSIPLNIINLLKDTDRLSLRKINLNQPLNEQKYNYSNILAEYRSGDEFQNPFRFFKNILIDKHYDATLLGPFITEGQVQRIEEDQNLVSNNNTRKYSTNFDPISNSNLKEGSNDSSGRLTNFDYSTWDYNQGDYNESEISLKHVIINPNVSSVFVTIAVNQLSDTLSQDVSAYLNTSNGKNKLSAGAKFPAIVNIQIETGSIDVKGVETTYQIRKFKIVALIQSPTNIDIGNSDLNDFKLSDYKFISEYASDGDIFKPFELPPVENDISALESTAKRYVKISKLSSETNSVLIYKNISLSKVTEIIPLNFNYPHSAIIGTKIDARSFATLPNRTYDCKLKKVKVPSNYNPLSANGKDKRYIALEDMQDNYSNNLTIVYSWNDNNEGIYSPIKFGNILADTKYVKTIYETENNVQEINIDLQKAYKDRVIGKSVNVNCYVDWIGDAGINSSITWTYGSTSVSTDITFGTGNSGETSITGLPFKNQSLPYIYSSSRQDKLIYDGDWDGTFKKDLEWTDNPAWILYDLITNERYGLGQYIDTSLIDIFDLYKIARFCDAVDDFGYFEGVPDNAGGLEPRFSCNILFTDGIKVFDALNTVASLFRGIIYYNNSQINFVDDRPKEPIALFSNTNVKEGIFNYANYKRDEQFNTIEVVYIDRFENFLTKVEYLEDEEDIRKRGVFKKTINANGVTSRAMARRLGQHLIFQTIKENQSVSFTSGLESLLCKPGDLIIIEDELKSLKSNFGKILSIDSSVGSIRLNEKFVSGDFDNKLTVYTPTGYSTYSETLNLAKTNRSRVNNSGFNLYWDSNYDSFSEEVSKIGTGFIFSKYMEGFSQNEIINNPQFPLRKQYAFYTGTGSGFCYFSTQFTGWILGYGTPFTNNNAYNKFIFESFYHDFSPINKTGYIDQFNSNTSNGRSGVPLKASSNDYGENSFFQDISGLELSMTHGLLDSDILLTSPPQITTFNITGITQYEYGCEAFVSTGDINYSLIPFIKQGSIYRFQRKLADDQIYKVISIKEENPNEYSLICTKFDTGKYALIENDKSIQNKSNTYSYSITQKIGNTTYQVLSSPTILSLTTGIDPINNEFYISGQWKETLYSNGYSVNLIKPNTSIENKILSPNTLNCVFYTKGVGNYSFQVKAIGANNIDPSKSTIYSDSNYSVSGLFLVYDGSLLTYDRPYVSSLTIL